ncbi:AraC family transcriptional regulator [Rubellicoccus peritrichatus]|uniref:AraC family transcriptional regulator n=1 Tax=Rubellicoccus peritrichatus TaxID=3080537 RepID=A0AAQ3QTP5_9BACT|nr:AraC family transcriptional regulator [Puniceicoccus sp. CR14]WOO41551.1 AraC family transcriptional regulator [Puniceicoccus sp. CR14]
MLEDVPPIHPLETVTGESDFAWLKPLDGVSDNVQNQWLRSLVVEPVCAYHWRGKPGWELEPRSVGDSMWFYFISGRGRAQVGSESKPFKFGPGSMIIIPKGRWHWIKLREREGMEMCSVHFHARSMGGFDAMEWLGFPPLVSDSKEGLVRLLSLQMAAEHGRKMSGFSLSLKSMITTVLFWVARCYGDLFTPKIFGHSSSGVEVVGKALEYIGQNYQEPTLSVGEMAQHCGVSSEYLRRLTGRYLNLSPRGLIVARRLEQSRSQLHLTNITVAEIADTCGFAEAAYFHRCFKQAYGVTPLAFRRGRYG